MESTSFKLGSLNQDLSDAICLLALLTQRQGDPEVQPTASQGKGEEHTPEAGAAEESDGLDGAEETKILSAIDVDGDEQFRQSALRSSVLDRLAETLARFKTDRGSKTGSKAGALDAKHVAGTMMMFDEETRSSRFLCAKNEGLDDADGEFLRHWKLQMEAISVKGKASEAEREAMFELVFQHQQPRIKTYNSWLRAAFAEIDWENYYSQAQKPAPSKLHDASEPCQTPRQWIDNNGLLYEFPTKPSFDFGEDESSDMAMTGDSFANVDDSVGDLFRKIRIVCNTPSDVDTAPVKQLMRRSLSLWKGARTRAAVKGRLRLCFGNDSRRKKDAQKALLFLCKIYHAALKFVEAAECSSVYTHIEVVEIPFNSVQTTGPHSRICTPMQAVQSLGLDTRGPAWREYFKRNTSRFQRLVRERRSKCNFHAELQVLRFSICNRPSGAQETHPYVGCSRLCCSLCHFFVRLHGGCTTRGTHETVLHRWWVPIQPANEAEVSSRWNSTVESVLQMIKRVLGQMFDELSLERNGELLAQSSVGFSSAQAMIEEGASRMEASPRELERLMMMPAVSGLDSSLIMRVWNKPERAVVSGMGFGKPKEMPITEAEAVKDQQLRRYHGLEMMGEMPRGIVSRARQCRRCHRPSSYRCAACKTAYCGRECQIRHWKRHLFVCCVERRPNDMDHLRLICRRWRRGLHERGTSRESIKALFSDDGLCRMLGFNNCFNDRDVGILLCIYTNLLHRIGSLSLQAHLEQRELDRTIESWAKDTLGETQPYCEPGCLCRIWFLQRRSIGFDIPNYDGPYLHQEGAWDFLDRRFGVWSGESPVRMLSIAEAKVLGLFGTLLSGIASLPQSWTSEWIDFGFCFCRSLSQRKALAKAHLKLLGSGASLAEIAAAWESSSLGSLMKLRGIDLVALESAGIAVRQPTSDEVGIYRLMAEVSHAFGGCGDHCARLGSSCGSHSKYETLLSTESEGDYGFHGASPWERWQLLNFYSHVFSRPDFDAAAMQEARHDADPGALEAYLDSLVPGFRMKICDLHLADDMFPKLWSRVHFPEGRPPYKVDVHTMPAPPGLYNKRPLVRSVNMDLNAPFCSSRAGRRLSV